MSDPASAEVADLLVTARLAFAQLNPGADLLTELRIWYSYDLDLFDLGIPVQELLDLAGGRGSPQLGSACP
jgi:hypothetical protein